MFLNAFAPKGAADDIKSRAEPSRAHDCASGSQRRILPTR